MPSSSSVITSGEQRGSKAPSSNTESLADEEWAFVATRLKLSEKQVDIIRLMAEGYQDKQISIKLNIEVSTVRTYITRIFHKLGVSSRVSLVVKVVLVACEYRLAAKQKRK